MSAPQLTSRMVSTATFNDSPNNWPAVLRDVADWLERQTIDEGNIFDIVLYEEGDRDGEIERKAIVYYYEQQSL